MMKMFFTQAYASLVKAVIGEPRITTMLTHSFKSSNLFACILSDYYTTCSYSSVWLERHSYKVEVTGSSPVGSTRQ